MKKNKITGEFRVSGLSAPSSFTFSNKGGSWWAVSAIPPGRYKALFAWMKKDDKFWKDHQVFATVEHVGLSSDGTPMLGRVIGLNVIDTPKNTNEKESN